MAQSQEVRGVATSVYHWDGMTHVRYHNTDVVSFDEKVIILRTGGYFTATTKLRMNQASNQYGLGFQVYARNHQWYVSYNEQEYRFPDDGDCVITR